MATINFVPDDYVQQRRASRSNVLYLMLLLAMLGAIGITFGFIKMRQRKVQTKLAQLNSRMAEAQQPVLHRRTISNIDSGFTWRGRGD